MPHPRVSLVWSFALCYTVSILIQMREVYWTVCVCLLVACRGKDTATWRSGLTRAMLPIVRGRGRAMPRGGTHAPHAKRCKGRCSGTILSLHISHAQSAGEEMKGRREIAVHTVHCRVHQAHMRGEGKGALPRTDPARRRWGPSTVAVTTTTGPVVGLLPLLVVPLLKHVGRRAETDHVQMKQ